MPEFEVEHDDSFTVVTNNILRNKELSMSEKGLLCTIFSLPPEWDYSFNGLVAICKEGKAAVRNSINEALEKKLKDIKDSELNAKLESDRIDLTLPSKKKKRGLQWMIF